MLNFTESLGQMRHNYVSRRLLFDDEEKISVNKPVDKQMIIPQSIDDLKDKVSNNKIIGSHGM